VDVLMNYSRRSVRALIRSFVVTLLIFCWLFFCADY